MSLCCLAPCWCSRYRAIKGGRGGKWKTAPLFPDRGEWKDSRGGRLLVLVWHWLKALTLDPAAGVSMGTVTLERTQKSTAPTEQKSTQPGLLRHQLTDDSGPGSGTGSWIYRGDQPTDRLFAVKALCHWEAKRTNIREALFLSGGPNPKVLGEASPHEWWLQ